MNKKDFRNDLWNIFTKNYIISVGIVITRSDRCFCCNRYFNEMLEITYNDFNSGEEKQFVYVAKECFVGKDND